MKFLHTLGAFGVAGGMAAFMLVLYSGPEIGATEEYASLRHGLDMLAGWIILPSVLLVLVSGLMSMAVHFPFQNMGWVWLKAATGLLIIEASLASIDAPAAAAARAAEKALAGSINEIELAALVQDKWVAWWIVLLLSVANVVLAIWRPRFVRRSRAATDPG